VVLVKFERKWRKGNRQCNSVCVQRTFLPEIHTQKITHVTTDQRIKTKRSATEQEFYERYLYQSIERRREMNSSDLPIRYITINRYIC